MFAPPDPASRTIYQPGELAQCDLWFPCVDIPLGHGQVGRPPVLVMVSGYSRVTDAVLLPSRQSPDMLAVHWLLLDRLGRFPPALAWDNESAVGSRRAGLRPSRVPLHQSDSPATSHAGGFQGLGTCPSSRECPHCSRWQVKSASSDRPGNNNSSAARP